MMLKTSWYQIDARFSKIMFNFIAKTSGIGFDFETKCILFSFTIHKACFLKLWLFSFTIHKVCFFKTLVPKFFIFHF
jgi:hypothetical protein